MSELEIKIPVSPERSYPIRIGTGILGSLWPEIESGFEKLNKFVVTDENLVAAILKSSPAKEISPLL